MNEREWECEWGLVLDGSLPTLAHTLLTLFSHVAHKIAFLGPTLKNDHFSLTWLEMAWDGFRSGSDKFGTVLKTCLENGLASVLEWLANLANSNHFFACGLEQYAWQSSHSTKSPTRLKICNNKHEHGISVVRQSEIQDGECSAAHQLPLNTKALDALGTRRANCAGKGGILTDWKAPF